MVHSMLFTNCVKEQCYQEEEENTSKQTHTYMCRRECTRAHTYTHTNTIGLDRE